MTNSERIASLCFLDVPFHPNLLPMEKKGGLLKKKKISAKHLSAFFTFGVWNMLPISAGHLLPVALGVCLSALPQRSFPSLLWGVTKLKGLGTAAFLYHQQAALQEGNQQGETRKSGDSHWCDMSFREGWEGFWSKHTLGQDFPLAGSPISAVTVKYLWRMWVDSMKKGLKISPGWHFCCKAQYRENIRSVRSCRTG